MIFKNPIFNQPCTVTKSKYCSSYLSGRWELPCQSVGLQTGKTELLHLFLCEELLFAHGVMLSIYMCCCICAWYVVLHAVSAAACVWKEYSVHVSLWCAPTCCYIIWGVTCFCLGLHRLYYCVCYVAIHVRCLPVHVCLCHAFVKVDM